MANTGLMSMDFMLSEDEALDLFTTDESTSTEVTPQDAPPEIEETEHKDKTDENHTTEAPIDTETLFQPMPESVGSKSSKKEDKQDKENTTPTDGADISPNTNFYSSYADAFRQDGIFQNLSEEDIVKVQDADTFVEAMELELQARLDEKQRRIDEALNARVEPSVVSQYENTLKYLDSINDSAITEENAEGEKLRTNLIYQDYLNRGFSPERAQKAVKRSLDSGTDIEDAQEALLSNKQFFADKYKELVADAKRKQEDEKEASRKETLELKNSILSEAKVFGDIEVDKPTRQKIYDNITRPIYKDPKTGELQTALQRYQSEHRQEFLKNLGLVFTLTDGFKNLDALVKNKVKKGVNKGIKDLEKILSTPSKPVEGNLRYMGGSSSTMPDSLLNGKFQLDI